MSLFSENTKYPFLRTAIVATNLIAPKKKVVDGIARLVTKSDCLLLCRKDKIMQVNAIEATLNEAWEEVQEAVKAGTMKLAEGAAAFGRLSSKRPCLPSRSRRMAWREWKEWCTKQ